MAKVPIILQHLSVLILFSVLCVRILILLTTNTEVSLKEPSIKATEQEAGVQTSLQREQDRERKISVLRETMERPKRLPFLKITKYTPKEITDILGLPPIKYEERYKNPCFKGDKRHPLFNDGELHCLPYFYILGVKKSGTTDLYARLTKHREFQEPKYKECQWFPRIRNGGSKKRVRTNIDNRNVKFYFSLFDEAARRIESCSFIKTKEGKVNPCITADATPANFHMHTGWSLLPGNEGLTEPHYTNFHYIKHLTPNAKIIIIFRDPVIRLFSDFLHEKHDKNEYSDKQLQSMFHTQARKIMQAYKECFSQFTMRRCIFNETLLQDIPKEQRVIGKSFSAGFYAFFMKEIYSVFSRSQIMTINMNRYVTNMEQTIKKAFKFLGMSPLMSVDMKRILAINPTHQTRRYINMFQKTKDMLYKFYKPYNEEMASILQDNSYLFKPP